MTISINEWLPSFRPIGRMVAVTAMAAIFAGTSAFAGNVHLKGGKTAEPAFQDLGLALEAMGSLAGLGNGDVLITLEAEADVISVCTNNGGNAAPGQNPAPITVSGSQAIPQGQVKNGTTPFDVTTVAPPSQIPGAPDCPNPTWVESIVDLGFTSALITVEQNGLLVLSISCTFNPKTTNGAISRNDVECSQF